MKLSGKGTELAIFLENTRPRYLGTVQRPARAWAKKACNKLSRLEGRNQIAEGLRDLAEVGQFSLRSKKEKQPSADIISLSQHRATVVVVTRKRSPFCRPVTEWLKLVA